jgi:hypothetical protein
LALRPYFIVPTARCNELDWSIRKNWNFKGHGFQEKAIIVIFLQPASIEAQEVSPG